MNRTTILISFALGMMLLVSCGRIGGTSQSGSLIGSSSSSSVSSSSSLSSVAHSGSTLSSSSHSAIKSSPLQLSVLQQADKQEAQPGAVVTYTITVRNTTMQPITGASVEMTFPEAQAKLVSAPGGATDANHVTWEVGNVRSLASQTYTLQLQLSKSLHAGDTVTTLVETTADYAVSQLSTLNVRIIGSLPQTGADDRFFAPIEDTTQYLSPVR